jgi:LPXTG-motif cell wall-anchored protein
VRNPVRKLMGVAVVGVLGALFAMPMVAAGAADGSTGSGGIDPAPPGDCVLTSVTPNPIPAFGTQVTISGTAPSTDNTHIFLFADGNPATPNSATDVVDQAITDGTFTLKYTVLAPVDLSVNFTFGNQNAYTAICPTVDNEVVVHVDVEATNVVKPPAAAAQAQALAFTGSNDTPSFVLVGIAALVLGAVLVIAARRRSQLS